MRYAADGAALDGGGADLLERGDEVGIEVLADLRIGQGVRTERLGVVSGEAGLLEIAGDVQEEHEFLLFACLPPCHGGSAGEFQARTVHSLVRGNYLQRGFL